MHNFIFAEFHRARFIGLLKSLENHVYLHERSLLDVDLTTSVERGAGSIN